MSAQSQSQLGVPVLPPRPSSAPPDNSTIPSPKASLLQEPSQTMGNINLQNVPSNAISSPELNQDHLIKYEKTSSRASRFVGNMLVSRISRASWQSLESTARLPFYLSPWGDNTPFTLPNIRKRDVALAGVAHFGLDALGASAVTVMEKAIEHAVSATVEQSADQGLEKATGRLGKGHTVERKVGMNSLTLQIRHKLIGEAAELVFLGVRDSADWMGCAKGWFCPYLYASGREPEIARGKDFAMAQLLQPRLAADASVAPALLASLAESNTPIASPFGIPWEEWPLDPTAVAYPKFRRVAVFVAGISPYRWVTTQSAWSHSRIPNEARITFHLFTHVPAIVLPVSDASPILAWSPWTVAQMLEKTTSYSVDRHVKEMCQFIDTIIDEAASKNFPAWRDHVRSSLQFMLTPILNVPNAVKNTAKKCCELERTGLIVFRY